MNRCCKLTKRKVPCPIVGEYKHRTEGAWFCHVHADRLACDFEPAQGSLGPHKTLFENGKPPRSFSDEIATLKAEISSLRDELAILREKIR